MRSKDPIQIQVERKSTCVSEVIDCLILRVNPQGWRTEEQRSVEKRGRSSAGRAPALQAGGRQFDPVRLHQSRKAHKHGWLDADREATDMGS